MTRENPAPPTNRTKAIAARTARKKSPTRKKTRAAVTHITEDFILAADGVYRRRETQCRRTGQMRVHWQWICSPLKIVCWTRNGQSTSWGKLVRLIDPDGKVHEVTVPNSRLAGDAKELREDLMDRGLMLAPGSNARQALAEYISTVQPKERQRCVSTIGWHGPVFVLPDRVYGPQGDEKIVLQSPQTESHLFKISGDLPAWQECVGAFCVGNTRLVLAVDVALAAVLLQLANETSGGFHFRGASQTGKTTTLRVAGSVCGGGGADGYHLTWRVTSNGLESTALAHNHMLLALDEIGQVEGREAGEIAYMLANGRGKGRAGRTGEARPTSEWRLHLLSTGEMSLAQKMAEGDRKTMAGQEVRLIDVPADAGAGHGIFENLHGFADGGALAIHLRNSTLETYGAPISTFLDRLTHMDVADVRKLIVQERTAFAETNVPREAAGQVKSVAARFALTVAAGILGVRFGVLPWTEDECRRAAAACFQDWLHARGGADARENREAIAQVKLFLERHGQSRFADIDDQGWERSVTNRAGFRRVNEAGEIEFLILSGVFREEVCKGLDLRTVCNELKAHQYLVTRPNGQPSTNHRLPLLGEKPTTCYQIRGRILGDPT